MTSWIVRHYHPTWARLGLIVLTVAVSLATGQNVVLAGEDDGGG